MDDLEFIIERKILKIGNTLLNTRSEDLKKYDLTPVQSETLLFYASAPGASILNLKEHLDISHSGCSNASRRRFRPGRRKSGRQRIWEYSRNIRHQHDGYCRYSMLGIPA